MTKNKSIDGLTIRDADKSALNLATKQKKPNPNKKATKIPIEKKEEPKKESQKPINMPIKKQSTEDFLKPVHAFDFNGETGELKASKKTKKDDLKIKKKKPSKKRRIILTIIITIVVILAGLITWLILWGNDIIAKITGGNGNLWDLIQLVEPTYDPLKTDSNGRTNILAFGTSGYNMEGDEGNGVHDGAQLTDSIMLISFNQETGDVAMISLPRDLKASPTCTATGKINEVYWCNNMNGDNEEAGATALMAEVSSILGVDIQYYAHLNWGSLISIVDILGGINVTLDEDIQDYYWTGAVFEAGVEYTLDGAQALGLARARHGTLGGDFSRGASQQKILIGIKNKVAEKDFSITDLLDLATTLGDNLRTNFSINEMKTLAHLSFVFDFDHMRQISLVDHAKGIYYMTTGNINGISYVLPSAGVGNYGAIQEYVAKNLSNNPRVYEEPTIIILNATDEIGLAASEQEKLTESGYDIAEIGDITIDETEDSHIIYYTSDNTPGTLSMLEEYYNTTPKPAGEAPYELPAGYDIIIILNQESKVEE